jgi:hypothetical protein
MHKFISLGFACLFLSIAITSAAPQQEKESELGTEGWTNGRAWSRLDAQSRIMFVNGIEEGIYLMTVDLVGAAKSVAEANAANLTIKGFRMGDIADQITLVYKDSANIRIPVAYVYAYAIKKMKGASPSDLEVQLAHLRQTFNK